MDVQERVLGALREHVGRPVRLDERLKDLGFRIPTNASDSLDWLELVMTFEKVVAKMEIPDTTLESLDWSPLVKGRATIERVADLVVLARQVFR